MWLASYVITLANVTGWTEDFILWELPLARGHQYNHAALINAGAKTVQIGWTPEKEIEEVLADLDIEELDNGNSGNQSKDQS